MDRRRPEYRGRDGGTYTLTSNVVTLYHLRDEWYRPMIAQSVGVHSTQVECDLMSDIRQVRSIIIHNRSIVPDGLTEKIEFLPQIWSLYPGELQVTNRMIHAKPRYKGGSISISPRAIFSSAST